MFDTNKVLIVFLIVLKTLYMKELAKSYVIILLTYCRSFTWQLGAIHKTKIMAIENNNFNNIKKINPDSLLILFIYFCNITIMWYKTI